MADYGQGLQGAVGGAMAGGSLGGPWGAAAGGALGGIAGLFGGGGGDDIRQQLLDYARRQGGGQAPQAGPASLAGASPYEAQRAGYLSQLQGWANGTGPSAAAMQMRQAMDTASANQSGFAAGAAARGGGGPGGAALQAMNNTAALQGGAARDTAVIRSQEQMNALGMLGQNLQAGIGQNQQQSQFNAQQQNQMAQANLEAKLRAMGITTNAQLQALIAAMGGASPGLGTQILAGGAQVGPYMAGANAAGRGGEPAARGSTGPTPNPFPYGPQGV